MPKSGGPIAGDEAALAVPDSTEVVYEGPLFRVERQRWPGGVRRDVVKHLGACGAVVLVGDGRVLLVRQRREAVGLYTIEIPAGVYDRAAESPEEAIRREVHEETGYGVTRLRSLGSILTTPGFTDERIDLFVAEAVAEGTPQENEVEPIAVALEDAVAAARDGRIADGKTVAALLRYAAGGGARSIG